MSFVFVKQKTAYEMRISDWSSDVCASDLDWIEVPKELNVTGEEYNKRISAELNTFIGGNQVPRVVLDLSEGPLRDPAVLAAAGYLYSPLLDKYHMGEQSVDFVYLRDRKSTRLNSSH